MRADELLKISERVEIEVTEKGEYFGNYLSRIEDMKDNKEIMIGLPLEKGTIVPLRTGSLVNINLTKQDGVYTFAGRIMKRELKPYPYFVIEYPKNIKRIQRRNYVRIPINLVIMYKNLGTGGKVNLAEIPEEKGVTVNLSGGGMSFLSIKDMEMESILNITFSLPSGVVYKDIKSKIKRKEKVGQNEKTRLSYGIEFLEMDEKMRDLIIVYLFELQRERQSKGINF